MNKTPLSYSAPEEKKRLVVQWRKEDPKKYTYEYIGLLLGVSRQRAHRLHKEAEEELNNALLEV